MISAERKESNGFRVRNRRSNAESEALILVQCSERGA